MYREDQRSYIFKRLSLVSNGRYILIMCLDTAGSFDLNFPVQCRSDFVDVFQLPTAVHLLSVCNCKNKLDAGQDLVSLYQHWDGKQAFSYNAAGNSDLGPTSK